MTTSVDLEEMVKIARDVTSPTWSAIGGTVFCDGADEHARGCFILYDRTGYSGPDCNRDKDSKFIAYARNHWPAICAELRLLREENERLKAIEEKDSGTN